MEEEKTQLHKLNVNLVNSWWFFVTNFLRFK